MNQRMRRIKRIGFLVAFLLYIMPLAVYAQPSHIILESEQDADTKADLSLYARSALLMDASNGRVLYEENGFQVMAMASTTKIMTCIIALEYGNLEDTVTVTSYAASMPKVHLGMRKGEQYILGDLLYSLMLESHNDSAAAIAEHIGGSVEGFADMMNQKARDIGCTNTFFITPNGLDAAQGEKTHSSTAEELGKIASYAIKNEALLKIISTKQYSFSEQEKGRQFQISNKNRFLDMMEGAIGIKTGFTNKAGFCFVGAIDRGEKQLVSVVLASGWPPNKNWKWSDTQKLMNYGLETFEQQDIFQNNAYSSIPVPNGIETEVEIGVEEQEIKLLLGKEETIEVKHQVEDELLAPVGDGQIVGYESYYIDGEFYSKIPIKTKKNVDEYTFSYCTQKVYLKFLQSVFPK